MIDFRSDTVTRPSAAMLSFMLQSQLGDDVFMEDPTVNELEKEAAAMFGIEAGLFCPSGTMANQIAIKVHTHSGDEVICDKLSHIYQYEGGGIAFNSGCSVRLLEGNRGRVTAQQVLEAINPDDIHKPVSTLVSLENTANRGGGSCYEMDDLIAIKEVCKTNKLAFHLDGARLFNALVAKNQSAKQYGELFDSISICLSKGLGAPVGSVLLGSQSFIKKARRIRKVLGGGMRQAGVIAGGALYALRNNIERLAQDHDHAKLLASELSKKDFVSQVLEVETNILIFELSGRLTARQFVEKMKEETILCIDIAPTQVRMVTHLDITPAMIDQTIEAIKKI